MAQWLKQSTATSVLLGPFVDDADGKTAETALTISQSDVLVWKEGGTTVAAKSDATSATHRASGYYTVPLDSTDTGTLGALTVAVHETGALPVRHEFFVVPAAVYDAVKAGTGNGVRADVQALAANSITATAIATDAINASKLASSVGDEIAAAIKALVIETNGSITVGQALSVILAATAGVTSTSGAVVKDPSGTSTRITATLNGSNERTAMTLAPSA
jgi:hypothetical protein